MFEFLKKALNMERPMWFQDFVNEPDNMARINGYENIKEYLLRKHKILLKKNLMHGEEQFTTSKIVFNTIKRAIYDHVNYVIANPISLNGQKPEMVALFNSIYKRGGYDITNFKIVRDLIIYANAYEYPWLDVDNGNKIKSYIILPNSGYPIYSDDYEYIGFVERWQDKFSSDEHFFVYYTDRIERYTNGTLVDTRKNVSGYLPIHYAAIDRGYDDHFGEPWILDVIPIMDEIEALLSNMNDGVNMHSLKPLGVSIGKQIETKIPREAVGSMYSVDDGGDIKYLTAKLDYESAKLQLDNLWRQFYEIACIPAVSTGQQNASNISEVSLKLLFHSMSNRANETIQALNEGFTKRHECFRKLLERAGTVISEEDVDGIGIEYNLSQPMDTSSLMNELKTQREMGAISTLTILEKSPYTQNTALEQQRLKEEAAASAGVAESATEKRTEGDKEKEGEENEND